MLPGVDCAPILFDRIGSNAKETMSAPLPFRTSRRESLVVIGASYARDARITARRMRVCVPQRQRVPERACCACCGVGLGVRDRKAAAVMIMPDVQYPH